MTEAARTRPPPFLPNWPARLAWLALAAYAIYAASILGVTWERFIIGLDNGAKFTGRMSPPDTGAEKMALLAANNITPNAGLNYGAKLMLVSSRSVNSLVWALLFVAIFGPGALAGTMAIAFRSIGFVGKLLGEVLEEARPGPVEALRAAGAPWTSIFIKGYWPQVEPAFWAIALFRWDISVRESAVLGLVGAGGIGMAINAAMDLFRWERVALMLAAIFAVVLIAEVAVTYIRRKIL